MTDFNVMFPNMRRPINIPDATLFGDSIVKRGAVSTFIGSFFENLVSDLFVGEVLKTDSQYSFCPDVLIRNKGIAIETKSARRGGEFFISDKQLIKYKELVDKGYTSWYAFCSYTPNLPAVKRMPSNHTTKLSLTKSLYGKTYEESLEMVCSNIDYVIVVDIEVLGCILKTYSTRRSCSAWVKNGRSDQFTYLRSSNLYPARSNVVQFMKDIGLERNGYTVTLSIVDDASVLGVRIKPFDFIIIGKTGKRSVEITPQSFVELEEIVTEIPEEEAPF